MAIVFDHTALLGGSYWTGDSESGQSTFVTYSMPRIAPGHLSETYTAAQLDTWVPFEATAQAQAEFAIDALEAITGLQFLEVETGGDVTFQWIDFDTIAGMGSAAGFAFFPGTYSQGGATDDTASAIGGDVFLNAALSLDYTAWTEILLHELGHAMGLEHPFEGENVLADQLDNEQQTVMSYTDVPSFDALQYGPLDIDALEAIYGRPGDFGAHLSGWAWNAATAQLSQTGTAGGDDIQGTSAIDIIKGLDGADTLTGYAGDDFLSGQDGDDYGHGGQGHDQIFMGAGRDTAEGGDGNDEIGGGDGDDTLRGDAGDDTLYGGAGADDLYGGTGRNVIWAGTGADAITQFSNHVGDDILGGGAGGDTIFAGDGNDILYGGKGDATTNADRLIAGDGADTIFAGNGADSLFGGTGNDLLFGGAGNDQISGNEGDDTLWGGAGDDYMWGDFGADVFAFVPGSGRDTIGDLDAGADHLDLTAYGLSPSALSASLSSSLSGVTITLDAQSSVFVFDASEADIQSIALL